MIKFYQIFGNDEEIPMKEKYEYPVAELVELTCDDIIMTSGGNEDTSQDDGWGDE